MGESRRSEIFIGLIGAVGVDLDDVAGKLGWALEQARYVPLTVRVSACVAELLGVETDDLDEESRVECLQDAGDRLRTIADNGAAAMFPTIADICRQREANKANDARAYIIKSMKRPEEVQFLRQVYGDHFFAIGCVAPLVKRKEYLKRVIQNKAAFIKEAKDVDQSMNRIIARDESDEQNDRGQNVRDTLVLADAIVDAHDENLQSQIDRLCDLMFGSPWETPTLAEYAATPLGGTSPISVGDGMWRRCTNPSMNLSANLPETSASGSATFQESERSYDQTDNPAPVHRARSANNRSACLSVGIFGGFVIIGNSALSSSGVSSRISFA